MLPTARQFNPLNAANPPLNSQQRQKSGGNETGFKSPAVCLSELQSVCLPHPLPPPGGSEMRTNCAPRKQHSGTSRHPKGGKNKTHEGALNGLKTD